MNYQKKMIFSKTSLCLTSVTNLLKLAIFGLVFSHCLVTNANGLSSNLRGITVLRPPFVERDSSDGKLKGYFVDLLDQLALIGKFNYTLSEFFLNDNLAHNDFFQNRPTGLINELYRNRADFAIADHLFRSTARERYVDFTDPYLESGLSVLVDKNQLVQNNIQSVDKLLDLGKPTNPNEAPNSADKIAVGAIRSTYRSLSITNDQVGRKIYERLHSSPNTLEDTRERGIDRALKGPYAFIQESIQNELAVDEHCQLTQLLIESGDQSPSPGLHLQYGIAVQKFSPLLENLNSALKKLKSSGQLTKLKQKYWNRKCTSGSMSMHQLEKYRYYLSVMCTFLSLSISLFLLS